MLELSKRKFRHSSGMFPVLLVPDRRYAITEDEFWDDEPYISYFGYGWMRRYREKVMEHCSHFSDMKIALTRATAVFGPYDNFDLKGRYVKLFL